MRIGAAYIRVSTDDQMEFSPDSQLHKIKEYAKSHDIILPQDFIFMEDDGISGRNASKRPEFQRMISISKSKPKPFEVILVWKFSRFARNREDSIVYKSMLRKQQGIDVVSVSENLGDDKMSILIEAIIEAMDEWYSINLSEEVKRGMAEKARRGGIVGSPAYGYRSQENSFVPIPEEAKIVQFIFDKFINEPFGFIDLARLLNTMGIKTRRGNRIDGRYVEYVLTNPVYIGKIKWTPQRRKHGRIEASNAIISDGTHEHIISDELFAKAQEKVNTIKFKQRKYERTDNHNFILQGLVKCSNCGKTMTRSRDGLQCNAYSKGVCDVSHYISMNQIVPRVIDILDDFFTSGNFEITVKQNIKQTGENDIIQKQIGKEKMKLEKIKDAFQSGIDTIEEYRENKTKITESIKTLEARLVEAPAEVIDYKKAFLEKNKNLISVLRNPLELESEKNKALKMCVEKIVFNRPLNEIQIFLYL